MALDPRFIGILCYCKSDKKELINSENNSIFDFGISSEDSLIERSLNNLGKICYHIYFFIDDESYQFTETQLKLFEQYNVEVFFKSNMTPYSLIEKISLLIGEDDVIIFNQVGNTYDSHGLSRESLEIVKKDMDSPWVFCEDLEVGFNRLPFEISHNLKSIWISDFFQAGFVSASGRLIRWSGILVISKRSFNNLLSEIDDCYQPRDFAFPEMKYEVPVPKQAMDLSFIMGSPAYSKKPFYLSIGRFEEGDFIKHYTSTFMVKSNPSRL